MGKIKVIEGGMFTTVQDLGRFGFRALGVPNSGAMDPRAMRWANKLVGNPVENPVIEMTLIGGKYQFANDAIIALTGADANVSINQKETHKNKSLELKPGDVLEVGMAKRGCRLYLAIRGRWCLKKVMDSYSTLTSAKLGGFEGRALQKGDVLEWEGVRGEFKEVEMPNSERTYFSSKLDVPVTRGPEWDWISPEIQQRFIETEFQVSRQSNRMGIRLEGNDLQIPARQMISSPVIPGIIQLPASGNPIILMNDGQTIGGYPRVAKVPDLLLWRLGQLRPGDVVRFTTER